MVLPASVCLVRSAAHHPACPFCRALQARAPIGENWNYRSADESGGSPRQKYGVTRLLSGVAENVSCALDHLEKEKQINYLAYHDVLTGLPNRTLLRDRLDQRIVTARHDQKIFAVVMLNLERFRNVNETLGQRAGDELLPPASE